MYKEALFEDLISSNGESKYTTKVGVLQYLPVNECPSITQLCSTLDYENLIQEIEVNADISEEEKSFLKLAAARHIVFNYSKIADYYSHASKEMQKLMEKSALVLIDFDDAIVNGYVKLDKKLTQLAEKAYEKRKAEKGA